MFTVNILCREHSCIPLKHELYKGVLAPIHILLVLNLRPYRTESTCFSPIAGHFHSAVCLGLGRLNWI